jgi:hypothetical protein
MTDQPKPRGRPPLPPEQRKGATPVRTVRLDDERWAKFQQLGRAWLERAIDRAKLPG